MNKMQKKIFNFENHIQDQVIEILQQLMLYNLSIVIILNIFFHPIHI